MPFLQTVSAAGGGGVLGDKDGMVFHGRLSAVIRRIGGSKSFCDEVSGVVENNGHALLPEVVGFPLF